eukprot:gene10521-7308_t
MSGRRPNYAVRSKRSCSGLGRSPCTEDEARGAAQDGEVRQVGRRVRARLVISPFVFVFNNL